MKLTEKIFKQALSQLSVKEFNVDDTAMIKGITNAINQLLAQNKFQVEIHPILEPILADETYLFFIAKLRPTLRTQEEWMSRISVDNLLNELDNFILDVNAFGRKYSNYSAAFTIWLKQPSVKARCRHILNAEAGKVDTL